MKANIRNTINKIKCWWNHDWEFDGGRWILKNASITTRKCIRCGLKQDIEHYHLLPSSIPGEPGHGICVLHKERKPGDADYDMKYEMNERPK